MTSPLALFTTNGTVVTSLSPVALSVALTPTHPQFGPHPPRPSRKTGVVPLTKLNWTEFSGVMIALQGSAARALAINADARPKASCEYDSFIYDKMTAGRKRRGVDEQLHRIANTHATMLPTQEPARTP